MKKRIARGIGIFILLLAGFLIYKEIQKRIAEREHREWVASLDPTASAQVHILPDTITVDYLGAKRTLALYLPADYARQDSVRYPVIYFLDGESLFDQKLNGGAEWEIDETLDSLGLLAQQQTIVVGIYSSDDRLREYKPFPSDRWYSHKRVSGDQHADWIVKSVKPWIDARYRTQPESAQTVIAGASLGGLMAYYMLMTYPEVFGNGIVLSPSFWVNESVYSLHKKNTALPSQRIFFNAGELETPTVESVEKMHQILLQAGMPADRIRTEVEPALGHWHITWERGFPKAYPWILTG